MDFNIASYNGNTFAYDAENHLVGGSMQATYDGLGRCVRRTTAGGTILFTYDGWKPILEWVDWGGWLAWNVYGAGSDEILARHDWAGGDWIYKQDKQGSVVAVLDGSGTVAEKYHYDAFGQPTVTDYWGNVRTDGNGRPVSWCGNRFMFTGREYIAELGIYDYRHRMYHPALGRFLQSDPMGFDAGDMNLFRYCDDDPVDRSDPTGLEGEDYTLAEAEQKARAWVKKEAFGQKAGWDPVLPHPTTHGKLVPILARGHERYELGKMSTGKTMTEYQSNGVAAHYDLETPDVTKEQHGRIARLIHSHQDSTGPSAYRTWSDKDRTIVAQGIPVERVDESNPNVWVVREPARNKVGYNEFLVNDAGQRLGSSSGSTSNNDPGAAPSAADVDKAHQATGVPSLGAEAVNYVNGRL